MTQRTVKVGQWAVLELPGGQVVQGTVERVSDKSVWVDGWPWPRKHLVSAMGPMTVDDDGTVKQNPRKKGRTMATKKKPTAKQLAARKRFAEMARSGAFKRKRAANPARKTAATKVARKVARKRPVSKQTTITKVERRVYANPKSRSAGGAHKPRSYAVHRATNGVAGQLLATFPKKSDAVQYGRAIVKARRFQVVIVGKR